MLMPRLTGGSIPCLLVDSEPNGSVSFCAWHAALKPEILTGLRTKKGGM